jgi:type IV pilus assembly protein PilE
MQKENGFTLIDSMIALTIIAILAATALPVYRDSVRKARRAEGRSALMSTMQRQERHFTQHGVYVAFNHKEPNGYKWHSGERAEKSAYELDAKACEGMTIAECVVVSARPGTPHVNAGYDDPYCGDLTLASNGMKTPAQADCW